MISDSNGVFMWDENQNMIEIGMTSLTTCFCNFDVNYNSNMKWMNLPNLRVLLVFFSNYNIE